MLPHICFMFNNKANRQGCGVRAGVRVRVTESHGNEPGVGVGDRADQTAMILTPECFYESVI